MEGTQNSSASTHPPTTSADADKRVIKLLTQENATLKNEVRRLERQVNSQARGVAGRDRLVKMHALVSDASRELLEGWRQQSQQEREAFDIIPHHRHELNEKWLVAEEEKIDLAMEVSLLQKTLEHAEAVSNIQVLHNSSDSLFIAVDSPIYRKRTGWDQHLVKFVLNLSNYLLC